MANWNFRVCVHWYRVTSCRILKGDSAIFVLEIPIKNGNISFSILDKSNPNTSKINVSEIVWNDSHSLFFNVVRKKTSYNYKKATCIVEKKIDWDIQDHWDYRYSLYLWTPNL